VSDEVRGSRPGAEPAPAGGDPALDEATRSAEACPRCGAHRLALLNLPTIDTSGYRPLDEIYGLVTGPSLEAPGIGCLACGAEWPDLADFKAEAEGQRESGSRP
jgi:hypothetical protein